MGQDRPQTLREEIANTVSHGLGFLLALFAAIVSLPALAQGNVAQQVFWYTAFTASMVAPKKDGNNTVDDKGMPLWRMAPSPKGSYWQDGMKLGYQDAGSWTLFKSTPLNRRQAAWLYAQFVVSKTVDTKKSHVGLTFIRDSTVRHASFTERAPCVDTTSTSARSTSFAMRCASPQT